MNNNTNKQQKINKQLMPPSSLETQTPHHTTPHHITTTLPHRLRWSELRCVLSVDRRKRGEITLQKRGVRGMPDNCAPPLPSTSEETSPRKRQNKTKQNSNAQRKKKQENNYPKPQNSTICAAKTPQIPSCQPPPFFMRTDTGHFTHSMYR